MTNVWDQARVEQYIIDQMEESLTLDYKAAAALAKDKRSEITKDVSAMANSAGGIIIYGIAEDPTNKTFPGNLDPVDRSQVSKEWLDQIISNIRPKIDGIEIHPVPIKGYSNHAVYVLEIPQSHTAHQATDKRYYKRFNFQSESMEDYEIRDVMGRGQYPRIEPRFEIVVTEEEVSSGGQTYAGVVFIDTGRPVKVTHYNQYELLIRAFNSGRVYALYVNVSIYIPNVLLPPEPEDDEELLMQGGPREKEVRDGVLCYCYYDENTVRDYIGPNQDGPARYDPILPGRSLRLEHVYLTSKFETLDLENLYIEWKISADNAPELNGRVAVSDIRVTDKRPKDE